LYVLFWDTLYRYLEEIITLIKPNTLTTQNRRGKGASSVEIAEVQNILTQPNEN